VTQMAREEKTREEGYTLRIPMSHNISAGLWKGSQYRRSASHYLQFYDDEKNRILYLLPSTFVVPIHIGARTYPTLPYPILMPTEAG
jgi:hypothetical protein